MVSKCNVGLSGRITIFEVSFNSKLLYLSFYCREGIGVFEAKSESNVFSIWLEIFLEYPNVFERMFSLKILRSFLFLFDLEKSLLHAACFYDEGK